MADLRNFRSSYLEKVGIKGVEEKKSIEILLKEQTLDLSKLVQFCLRFPVPAFYRPYLWKVLLGVLPPHQDIQEVVSKIRRQQYDDLKEALEAMCRIDKHTPLEDVHLHMFLIEEGWLPFQEHRMMEDESNRVYVAMDRAMAEVVEDPVDIYWMTAQLFRQQRQTQDSVRIMIEKTEQYLRKEDGDGRLVHHLVELHAFNHLPLAYWFNCCYAGLLPETSFERIWDKVIGGSCKILVYVAVSILLTFKRPILSMTSIEEILKYLSQIPADSGDIIVSKALEIWQKYGSLLTPVSAKEMSPIPNLTDRAPS